MSVTGFHGDPCSGHGCARLKVKHRAEIDGLCRSCWLGSSAPQRLDAELESLLTPTAIVAARVNDEANAAFEAWGRL